MHAERRDYATKQRARLNVAHESYEVANFRVEKTESRRRIGLRMRRIGKIANCFEADHCSDFVATRLASAGVNETSHFIRQKIGRLLVHKRDETQCVLRLLVCKAPRE